VRTGTDIGRRATGRAAALAGALAVLLAAAPLAAAQTRPAHGLVETRTGLPRTLPLVVAGPDGRDALVEMRDARTGEVALTAYARAGRPLRVLMPPGRYTLRAALGRDWQGPERLFGDETGRYVHPVPLDFRAGYARKRGQFVDLAAGSARGIATCGVAVMAGRDRPTPPVPGADMAPGVSTSVAPDSPAGPVPPPGPRDPMLDGWPDLGASYADIVPDVPIGQKLGEGRLPSLDPPAFDVPRRTVLRERACDPD